MNKNEYLLIDQIVKRAMDSIDWLRARNDYLGLSMDIENTHLINPLRLKDLLNAPQGDFNHDVTGIYNNFNRETKQLDNCFAPRFSQRIVKYTCGNGTGKAFDGSPYMTVNFDLGCNS